MHTIMALLGVTEASTWKYTEAKTLSDLLQSGFYSIAPQDTSVCKFCKAAA